MIPSYSTLCPKCYIQMRHYDKVSRIVRCENNLKYYIQLNRVKCPKCKHVHRVIPDVLFPYKQYEARIILKAIFGLISSDLIEFEDYPCERTFERWRKYYIDYYDNKTFKGGSIYGREIQRDNKSGLRGKISRY